MVLIPNFYFSEKIGKGVIRYAKLLPIFVNLISLTSGQNSVKSLGFIKIAEEIKFEKV